MRGSTRIDALELKDRNIRTRIDAPGHYNVARSSCWRHF
jgi:hypothetical protein